MLPKQSYNKVIKDAALKSSVNNQESTEAADNKTKSKKLKTHSSSKTKEKSSENNEKSGHKKKKSSKMAKSENGDAVDLLGTPVKESKDKFNKKDKKEKKSSKSKKAITVESKSGYEEALGISTPSKEVY